MQLANPALASRHWEQIFSIVESTYTPGQPVCVHQLLQLGVLAKIDEVQAIAGVAKKEYSMLKMLEKMEKVLLSSCVLPSVAPSCAHRG
jgi:dynein heavy chain, axonemal